MYAVRVCFWELNWFSILKRGSLHPLMLLISSKRLKSRKILLSTEGPGHNVLKLKPPMVFNHSDAQHLLVELQQVLRESPMQ
jgi:4-aminobutyrate aminotransferase and related aminotransferases